MGRARRHSSHFPYKPNSRSACSELARYRTQLQRETRAKKALVLLIPLAQRRRMALSSGTTLQQPDISLQLIDDIGLSMRLHR